MTDRIRARSLLLDRGGLIALVTLVLYVWLAPAFVIDGDNAEFATLSVTGGAAHPSGYPLYVLWLRALSWLPFGSPAHTAAIATALLAAAANLVLYNACRAWGARPFAATVAVALFATGPVVLRLSTEAEVFILNNLAVAAVLWLAAPEGPAHGGRKAALLGLVAGLGLGNHLTCALVAPIGIYGVVCGAREAKSPARAVAAAVGMLCVGLLPYAYLFVASDSPMSWGVIRDVDAFVGMISRRDYGGPGGFRVNAVHVPATTSLLGLVGTIGRAWLWAPAVAGVVMLGVRCVRGTARLAFGMLALTFVIAGPLLVLRFNVPPSGLGLYVCQRFHVLPALLLAIPIALAVDRIPVRRAPLACTLAATVGVAGATAVSLPYLARIQSPAVELSARNMLESLPPDAVVVHVQDELHAVPGYVQAALGERRDVVIVTWPMMTLDWYRDRIAARGLAHIQVGDKRHLIDDALARGRPVFIDRLQRDVIDAYPTYPWGALLRVLPRGSALPSAREMYELNDRLFGQFNLAYATPGPDDEFATEAHRRYAATWMIVAYALSKAGESELANQASARAHALAPWEKR